MRLECGELTAGWKTLTASMAALPVCLQPKTRSNQLCIDLDTYEDSSACLRISDNNHFINYSIRHHGCHVFIFSLAQVQCSLSLSLSGKTNEATLLNGGHSNLIGDRNDHFDPRKKSCSPVHQSEQTRVSQTPARDDHVIHQLASLTLTQIKP